MTVDIGVGQIRAIDFVADEPGDWAVHCHKSHHTMNPMGHNVRNYIGANLKDAAEKIGQWRPATCPWVPTAWRMMAAMEMPLPDNTLPMMSGDGPFGSVEMGGMFTVLKVRDGLARGNYADPGWFKHPEGTVAFEYAGPPLAEPPRAGGAAADPAKAPFRAVDPAKRRDKNHQDH